MNDDDRLVKDNNKMKKSIEGFKEEGSEYFAHCSKEKINTIYKWCNQCLNNPDKKKDFKE